MNLQAIFQIKNDDGIWRDFAREAVDSVDEAERLMKQVSVRERAPFRVTVEDWGPADDRMETVKIGDWHD